MTPEQAIEEATSNGFCKISHKTYLFRTDMAGKDIHFDDTSQPFQLVMDAINWTDVYPIKNANSKKLREACEKLSITGGNRP
jgi:hypothetical protein